MRKNILLVFRLFVLFMFGLVPSLPPAVAAPSHLAGFVYADGDKLMLDGLQFVMKGFNYYPRDYGWTSLTAWDWQAVDRELALAASLNANTIRTGFSFPYSIGKTGPGLDSGGYQVTPEYLAAIDRFLGLADKHGLKVVFWLNDAMPWELYDPAAFPVVRQNLESLIPRYADDPRIAAWDLATDLDGTMLLPPPTGGYGDAPWMTTNGMVAYLRNVAEAVRSLDSNHLIAVGMCWPSSSLLVQDFTDLIFFQFLGADYPGVLSQSGPAGEADQYGRWWEASAEPQAVADSLEAKLKSIQSQLTRPMPIVLSEYGTYTAPPDSSPALQRSVYEVVLDVALVRLRLAGALNWALTDFIWPPKAYTLIPNDAPQAFPEEQSFGVFDLDYNPKLAAETVRLYYADQPEIVFQSGPEELQLVFSSSFFPADVEPGSGDDRELCVAFDAITFMDKSGVPLLKLDVGTPDAHPFLKKGFFGDEGPWETDAENFAWVGGQARTARVSGQLPAQTHKISLRLFNGITDMQMEVYMDGEKVETKTLQKGWKTYGVELPEQGTPAIGDTLAVRGAIYPPFSEGTVTLYVKYGQADWVETAMVTPAAGKFTLPLELEHGGAVAVRAAWSGAGYYLPADSQELHVDIPRGTSSLSFADLPPDMTQDIPAVITGSLQPPLGGETLSLKFKKTDGSESAQTVVTGTDGSFTCSFVPDRPGSWSVRASWGGSLDYEGAQADVSFVVAERQVSPVGLYIGVAVGAGFVLAGGVFLLRRKR